MNNKDKLNQVQKRYYQNNRQKQDSRTITKKLLIKEPYLLSKNCKSCGTTNSKNEIQHEVYPIIRENIRIAIKKGQIYYLCKNCHNKYHRDRNVEISKKSS